MLPLTLDLLRLRLALVGAGAAAVRRLERLDAAGARALVVYAPRPSRALVVQAGTRLVRRMPADADLAGTQIVFTAGLPASTAVAVAERARALGAIVHVEDAPAVSDVRMPAVLHRGDLTIAVSTGGRSPALAAALKDALGRIVGPEWTGRLDQIAAARRQWHAAGLNPGTVAARTGRSLAEHGWLASDATLESHWVPDAEAPDQAGPTSLDAQTHL